MADQLTVVFYTKDQPNPVRRIVIQGFNVEDIASLAEQYQEKDSELRHIKNLKHAILD